MKIQDWAAEIRDRKTREHEQEYRLKEKEALDKAEVMCKHLEELFKVRAGADLLDALQAHKIDREYLILAGGALITFTGEDENGIPRRLVLPVDEAHIQTFDVEILIMMLDKFILKGYPAPDFKPGAPLTVDLTLDGPYPLDFQMEFSGN